MGDILEEHTAQAGDWMADADDEMHAYDGMPCREPHCVLRFNHDGPHMADERMVQARVEPAGLTRTGTAATVAPITMPEGANTCTLELSNGGSVHVEHSEAEIDRMLEARDPWLRLKRVPSYYTRAAQGFAYIRINPAHVVGVYPLQSGSFRDEVRLEMQPVHAEAAMAQAADVVRQQGTCACDPLKTDPAANCPVHRSFPAP